MKETIFTDMMEALQEVKEHKAGKKILQGKKIEIKPVKKMSPAHIKHLREQLHVTQIFFARILGVSPRTIEAWESGNRTPSDIALRFMQLIENNTEILDDIIKVQKAS